MRGSRVPTHSTMGTPAITRRSRAASSSAGVLSGTSLGSRSTEISGPFWPDGGQHRAPAPVLDGGRRRDGRHLVHVPDGGQVGRERLADAQRGRLRRRHRHAVEPDDPGAAAGELRESGDALVPRTLGRELREQVGRPPRHDDDVGRRVPLGGSAAGQRLGALRGRQQPQVPVVTAPADEGHVVLLAPASDGLAGDPLDAGRQTGAGGVVDVDEDGAGQHADVGPWPEPGQPAGRDLGRPRAEGSSRPVEPDRTDGAADLRRRRQSCLEDRQRQPHGRVVGRLEELLEAGDELGAPRGGRRPRERGHDDGDAAQQCRAFRRRTAPRRAESDRGVPTAAAVRALIDRAPRRGRGPPGRPTARRRSRPRCAAGAAAPPRAGRPPAGRRSAAGASGRRSPGRPAGPR